MLPRLKSIFYNEFQRDKNKDLPTFESRHHVSKLISAALFA